MTTENTTIATFDIPKARQQVETWKSELEEANNNLASAVAASDMATVMQLVPRINNLNTEIDKLARKIARESGEEVITKKVEIATKLKMFVVENLTRNAEFAGLIAEMQATNPKFKAINIDFTGDATQPGAVNIVGGFRQTDPAKKGTTKRPRAAWSNNSLGKNTDGSPKSLSTKEAILSYGRKYWSAVFGKDSQPVAYDAMSGNDRQKLIEAIVAGEKFNNLAKPTAN